MAVKWRMACYMFKLNTTIDQLLFATTILITKKSNGRTASSTAFFYFYHLSDNKACIFLVTNKHAVKEAIQYSWRMHRANGEGDEASPAFNNVTIDYEGSDTNWYHHPNNLVDLCILPISIHIRKATAEHGALFYKCFDKSILPSEEDHNRMTAAQDVVMVGYPIGQYDNKNNLPIIRRGITASHAAVNYNGKNEGVVDIACFPGSSGSPIIAVPKTNMFSTDGSIKISYAGLERHVFLGVLYGGPVYNSNGRIEIKNIPTALVPIPVYQQRIHLGYYIKSHAVEELCKLFVREIGIEKEKSESN